MKKILLIGCGQVGSQLKKIEIERGNDVYICEVDEYAPKKKYDVAHIAIPYSKNFVMVVTGYLLLYKPKLTIVHSTIPLGTTRYIINLTQMSVVHSPVIGNHPNIYESFKSEVKPIGGHEVDSKKAFKHLETILMKPERIGEVEISESSDIYKSNGYEGSEYKEENNDNVILLFDEMRNDIKPDNKQVLGYTVLEKVAYKISGYFKKNLYGGRFWKWDR